jgi:excisionase family DNA binding protein
MVRQRDRYGDMQITPDPTFSRSLRKREIPNEVQVLLTLQSTAKVLDLSIATVRRLEKAGKLRFVRVGGRTMVDPRTVWALAA